MSEIFDAVFVGSGINSLTGAALLAKHGWKVCVLERNSWFGGNIRTAELTEPGFLHDVYSAWHPLFTGSESYRILKPELEARGLKYLNTEYPTATLFPDQSAGFLSTSAEAIIRNSNTTLRETARHGAGRCRISSDAPNSRSDCLGRSYGPLLAPAWLGAGCGECGSRARCSLGLNF